MLNNTIEHSSVGIHSFHMETMSKRKPDVKSANILGLDVEGIISKQNQII